MRYWLVFQNKDTENKRQWCELGIMIKGNREEANTAAKFWEKGLNKQRDRPIKVFAMSQTQYNRATITEP